MVKKGESKPKVCFGGSIFLCLLIVALGLYSFQGIFIFGNLFEDSRDLIANLLITSLSLLAFISAILIYRRLSFNFPREKKANLFLIVSLFLFFLGDLLWLGSEILFGDLVPIGSIPDFAWLSAYIFLIISLIYFISTSFRPYGSAIYLVLLLGTIIGGAVVYFDVAEDLEEGSFTFVHAIQDAYILFDVIVVLLVIYLVWPIFPAGRRFYLSWILLGLGISTRVVYDQIFANMSQAGTYYTGHPIDLLYVIFYLCVVASSYFKSKILAVKND